MKLTLGIRDARARARARYQYRTLPRVQLALVRRPAETFVYVHSGHPATCTRDTSLIPFNLAGSRFSSF